MEVEVVLRLGLLLYVPSDLKHSGTRCEDRKLRLARPNSRKAGGYEEEQSFRAFRPHILVLEPALPLSQNFRGILKSFLSVRNLGDRLSLAILWQHLWGRWRPLGCAMPPLLLRN